MKDLIATSLMISALALPLGSYAGQLSSDPVAASFERMLTEKNGSRTYPSPARTDIDPLHQYVSAALWTDQPTSTATASDLITASFERILNERETYPIFPIRAATEADPLYNRINTVLWERQPTRCAYTDTDSSRHVSMYRVVRD